MTTSTTYEIPDDAKIYVRDGKRFAPINGEAEKYRVSTPERTRGLPPASYDSVREILRSYFGLVSGVLMNSDIAFRRDKNYQRQMRRDPDVMGPLLQRQTATALLEWDIVPDDEEDEEKIARAAELKTGIEKNFRRRHELIRHLLEAIWFGPSAANVRYARDETGYVVPVFWKPFHPDSLAFDHEGRLGMRVGIQFPREKVQGPDSNVHLFDDRERGAIVLHTAYPQAPDFDEPEEARQLFSGRGLRDIVYFPWKMKQVALQLWSTYVERYSMGMRIATYPSGDDDAQTEMETILRNAIGDTSVLFPRRPDNPEAYSFEVLEPNGSTAKIHADLIDGYLGGVIKELIVGQTATTEATNEGLGTGVSDQHAETFSRLIRWDAKNLEDSLTFDFLRPYATMNYGEDLGSTFRWKFAIPEVDIDGWLSGVERAVDLGLRVPANLVRGRLGLDEPEDGEEILERADPFGGGDFGGGALNFAEIASAKERYRLSIGGRGRR
jgi:hypothetical protein